MYIHIVCVFVCLSVSNKDLNPNLWNGEKAKYVKKKNGILLSKVPSESWDPE